MTIDNILTDGNHFGILNDDRLYKPHSTRVPYYQALIASSLGIFAITAFSILRSKYPQIYVANLNHLNFGTRTRKNLPKLTNSLFGWIPIVFKISEQEILEHAGLDAVVFLGFFKMCIKVIGVMLILAITVITPIRYKFTGKIDQDYPDDDDDQNNGTSIHIIDTLAGSKLDPNETYQHYLWLYTIFTYVFTFVTAYFLFDETDKVVNMRQKYLGGQNSITDRTVKISGIPGILRDEFTLKRHINNLNIGEVESVLVVREWQNLNKLFKLRNYFLKKLETYWVEYFQRNGIENKSDLLTVNLSPTIGESINMPSSNSRIDDDARSVSSTILQQITEIVEATSNSNSINDLYLENNDILLRPKFRKGWFGLFGPRVDAINFYTDKLRIVDKQIEKARRKEYAPTSSAFLTMKSVAQAQMLAQAVLDPKVNHLITSLAPAPHDIRWDNLCLTRQERNSRNFVVTLLIGVISVLLVFPVRYIASFLNAKSISKIWPALGEAIKAHHWLKTVITGLLPTYLFTILNIVIPFFYVWISKKQGFSSNSDEELSSIAKNFFYIFVNLFLVFTTFGTASLSDTTKIAYDLAQSLRDLSLFYVDFIILQGLAIFPFKLLLLGNLIKFSWKTIFSCKTPRDYLNLYKSPEFNFGLQLPQPILLFIITLSYSIISSKILFSAFITFVIGYGVNKYLLLYACVHSPHSTGKILVMIFRRIILGLLIFQITMVGTLALQQAYICAAFIAPLPMITMYFLWCFENQYIPLSTFIALRAIENNQTINSSLDLEENQDSNYDYEINPTLDERREFNTKYEYPNLICDLNGPMIALDGPDVLYIDSDGNTICKKQNFKELEI
ncbi:uncharacterized protein KGF55_000374 [Candida pseudojiufengensis]|uniref:uncharacterized protein n=1 Tax=Candida pseudojiufengensis TaxID=497109 RepID=UPI002224E877|nr:uncharacterized protein KGF55_000374 [Candida pseudojiufengensis]KAI5966965.1 hypothetical protein KGF55_000374 [Candida pseudojiufengensis]